ncbi:hypothetical protein PR048_028627 [Dryococelus australis]|uniref:Uncharacterized protein n=1 Tax=Dryococelus australis TaxID=614101 RepID=A0ABQ9GB41_9NEOP|nr:hypothetical protein PR048_028627 [Dryococelus australis]
MARQNTKFDSSLGRSKGPRCCRLHAAARESCERRVVRGKEAGEPINESDRCCIHHVDCGRGLKCGMDLRGEPRVQGQEARELAIRATLTRTPSASSLLGARLRGCVRVPASELFGSDLLTALQGILVPLTGRGGLLRPAQSAGPEGTIHRPQVRTLQNNPPLPSFKPPARINPHVEGEDKKCTRLFTVPAGRVLQRRGFPIASGKGLFCRVEGLLESSQSAELTGNPVITEVNGHSYRDLQQRLSPISSWYPTCHPTSQPTRNLPQHSAANRAQGQSPPESRGTKIMDITPSMEQSRHQGPLRCGALPPRQTGEGREIIYTVIEKCDDEVKQRVLSLLVNQATRRAAFYSGVGVTTIKQIRK